MEEEDEDTPTKRRSGAYGMMTQACQDTARELEALLRSSSDGPQRAELSKLLEEIRSLAVAVTRWQKDGIDEATKQGQIQRIIDITVTAQALGPGT